MLPARHRLTESGQFRTAVRKGNRAGTRTLVLHLQPTSEATPPLVGFVVSKAVGVAVTRNLVKRRLRHLVRDRLAALPVGAVLVIRALPGSAGASYDDLAADLDRGLTRLNLVPA